MSAIKFSTGTPLPFDIRGDPTWQVFGVLPLVGVLAAFLVAFVLVPGPPNLSLSASSADAGPLRITEVMTGGIAWDLGIRAGQKIVEFEGGEYQPGPPELLRDPVSVRVLDTASGQEIEIDARQHTLAQGVALPALWILATLFASLGGAIGWARAWDAAGRRLLLLFGFFAVLLATGTFSATKGGMIPVVVVGLTLSGTGYALVSLLSVFPYAPPLRDWRRKYLVSAFGIALVPVWAAVAGRLLTPSEEWYALARTALGLYMGGALLAAFAELGWSLRQNTSRGRRAQAAILIVTFTLGLGPLVFGTLLPRLYSLNESPLSLELAVFSLLLLPVGVAYTVVRYQSSHFYRQTENLLVPGTISIATFVFVFLSVGLIVGDIQGSALLGVTTSLLVGVLAAVLVGGGSAALGLGRDSGLETPAARRRQALLSVLTQITRAKTTAPMLLDSRQESSLQVSPALDILLAKLRIALGVAATPAETETDVVLSLKGLVEQTESLVPYPIVFDCHHEERRREVAPEVSQALYALTQHALSNVIAHSQATEVLLRLDLQQSQIAFLISDNGVGFDATGWERHPEYTGLQEILRRVRRIGGELHLTAFPGEGTWLHVTAPYAPPSRTAAP